MILDARYQRLHYADVCKMHVYFQSFTRVFLIPLTVFLNFQPNILRATINQSRSGYMTISGPMTKFLDFMSSKLWGSHEAQIFTYPTVILFPKFSRFSISFLDFSLYLFLQLRLPSFHQMTKLSSNVEALS